jgi:hypothetical protein
MRSGVDKQEHNQGHYCDALTMELWLSSGVKRGCKLSIRDVNRRDYGRNQKWPKSERICCAVEKRQQ